MSNTINVKLTGADDLLKFMKGLPNKLNRRVQISAQKKAGKILTKEMKSNVKQVTDKKSGTLEKSIGSTTLRTNAAKTHVTTFHGVRRFGRTRAWYAHMVEQGTPGGVRESKKGFIFRGKEGKLIRVFQIDHPGTKARPFAMPAIRSKKNEVIQSYQKSLSAAIEQHIKRTLKK